MFYGLRHSSATYQLLQSDGDFKSVQGNTGHATAAVLMDTYAHTQDKPRLELTEKIEANFYSQDLTPAAPRHSGQNWTGCSTINHWSTPSLYWVVRLNIISRSAATMAD